MKREETYTIENLEFYENIECYVKVWDSNGTETLSEIKTVKNTKIIKTDIDLKKFATQVNDKDNTFEGRTLQLIDDIQTGENWIPIGYWDGAGIFTGKYFAGTFEGNNHVITIASSSKNEKYKTSGLFGMVIGGTINNVTVNGKIDANCHCVGGIIGTIRNGVIYNCINNSQITNTTYEKHGGIVGLSENSQIDQCTNLNTVCGKTRVGGICGSICTTNSTISNCSNSGMVKCYGTTYSVVWGDISESYGIVGGICGEIEWETSASATIENCTNTGEVTGNADTILPNGIIAGGMVGISSNADIVTSKNKGKVHYDVSLGITNNGGALGGIVGISTNSTVNQCFNEAIITSKYNDNYGMVGIGGIVGCNISSIVKNTYNKGDIYGLESVGGIVGWAGEGSGVTGKNYLYNNYNANDTVIGPTKVGNYIGYSNNVIGAYNSGIKEKIAVGNAEGSNDYSDYEEYTLQQMKTIGSGLLTLLSNGEGKGVWKQESNVNEGMPYLINNRP